jgi:hypothetical protein
MFLGRDAQLRAGVILEALPKKCKHLLTALSCGADDEDVAESFLIRAVRFGERRPYLPLRAAGS